MRVPLLPAALVASVLGAGTAAAAAQTEVAIELGASQVGPPVGLETQAARFGVAGVRASHFALTGSSLSVSVLAGRAFGAAGGDFFSATLGGSLVEPLAGGWSAGMDLRFLGFGVRAPFPYRAFAAEGGPTLRYRSRLVSVRAAVLAGLGHSRVELFQTAGGQALTLEDDLWRFGGTAEFLVGPSAVRFGVAGGVHDTPGGTYGSGGGRVVFAGRWGVAELRADVWSTPLGTEATGGLVFAVPVSGWSFRGFFGRSEPDPLTLAEPGSGSGGLLVGRTIFTADPDRGPRPYEILSGAPGGARVRLSVEAPGGTRDVALLGDFTLWDPVPMRREGDRWVVELEVEGGTHHYGFLVDDEWYVPEDTPDVVPDEWGRLSAILVIEGA